MHVSALSFHHHGWIQTERRFPNAVVQSVNRFALPVPAVNLSTALCRLLTFRRSHKGLSPCDFHLIPKMKEPLRGIRFRTVPEILKAVDRSIRTINTRGAAKGILRLPHRWQRVVHNASDYIEGQ